MFRRAGLLGAGLAAGSVLTAGTAMAHPGGWCPPHPHSVQLRRQVPGDRPGAARRCLWPRLDGDHRSRQPDARQDRGREKVNPDIVAARARIPGTLVFQGLEWNIPAAGYGTVFVHPGRNEVALLKAFETGYSGAAKGTTAGTTAYEALAIAGVSFLADAVRLRRVARALFLANHPARKGIDSPHEIRAWRDHHRGRHRRRATGTRPVGRPHRTDRVAPVAVTTTARAQTPSRATRWRATGPGVASTGWPPQWAGSGTACSPKASRGGSPRPPTPTTSTQTPRCAAPAPTSPRTASTTTPSTRRGGAGWCRVRYRPARTGRGRRGGRARVPRGGPGGDLSGSCRADRDADRAPCWRVRRSHAWPWSAEPVSPAKTTVPNGATASWS